MRDADAAVLSQRFHAVLLQRLALARRTATIGHNRFPIWIWRAWLGRMASPQDRSQAVRRRRHDNSVSFVTLEGHTRGRPIVTLGPASPRADALQEELEGDKVEEVEGPPNPSSRGDVTVGWWPVTRSESA